MKKDKAYLQDILDSISDIELFIANITEVEFYKNVPSDCKVIIDTKNYNENLNDLNEQVRQKRGY